MTKRTFSFVSCCFAALLALPSVSRAEEKEVSIYTMQLKPMYTKYMEDVFKGFEGKNPGVKVKWLDYPAQDYETKLISLIVGGQAPDVQNLPLEFMLHLNDRAMLLNLSDKLSSDTKALYVDAVMKNGCSIDGHLYGIPWYFSTVVTMYNKDILKAAGLDPEKPPKNNTELFAMSRQIKAKTGKFGFLMTFSESGNLKSLLAAEGIPLTDIAKKKATFNTPRAVEIVKEYKKLFDEGVIPRESVTAEHRRALDLYKSGKTAFLISGPQFLMIVKSEAPDVYAATGIGPAFPVGDTGGYEVEMQNLCVSAKSANPKEAVDLALWVTNAENQLAFSKMVTIFPSVKRALADPYFSKPGDSPEDKARNIGAKQLEKAVISIPPLPHLPELNKAMNDAIQKVLLKNVSAEEAISEAEKKWNEILAK